MMSVRRTQIYLDDEESELLGEQERLTGASRSELIRRAVRTQYGRTSAERRLGALKHAVGTRGRDLTTGADYVEQLRRGLGSRLDDLDHLGDAGRQG